MFQSISRQVYVWRRQDAHTTPSWRKKWNGVCESYSTAYHSGTQPCCLQNASCYEEPCAEIDAVGLCFVRNGPDTVIFVGDTAVKPSSVDRKNSLSRPYKRFGGSKPGCYSKRAFHKPATEPISYICQEQWQEYQKERQRLAEERHSTRKNRKDLSNASREAGK